MKLQVVGCSHQGASLDLRERLAFPPERARTALARLRDRFPDAEAVLLSTCNRVELYSAAEPSAQCPSRRDVTEFLAEFHGLDVAEIAAALFEERGEAAAEHLFLVTASLDSMVVGEAQILSQVKLAYELAKETDSAGSLTHAAFQAAIRTAKRVAAETAIHRKRVSIPSIAVADFASGIFERFDDKNVLVIGAGEMGEETLRYLIDAGAQEITVVNRKLERAEQLAARTGGRAAPWDRIDELLQSADLVVSATGANEPVVTADRYKEVHQARYQRPLFVLDLAVPRDFDPEIGQFNGVYLYAIDDLKEACEANRLAREKEWPKATRIVKEETGRFMAEMHHRATGPAIRRLKARADELKSGELSRLMNKLAPLDDRRRNEIQRSFDRLVNKLLHPPLESLRDEAEQGASHGLLDALKQLFQLKD